MGVMIACISILLGVICIANIAYKRVELQLKADRAAYAAGAYMAHVHYMVAQYNRDLHEAFLRLQSDFSTFTQQHKAAAKKRYNRYVDEKERAIEKMNYAITTMPDIAKYIAGQMMHLYSPRAHIELNVIGQIELYKSLYSDQNISLPFHLVDGNFVDPEDKQSTQMTALSYMAKKIKPSPILIIHAVNPIQSILKLSTDPIIVSAKSVSAVIGGNIDIRRENKKVAYQPILMRD